MPAQLRSHCTAAAHPCRRHPEDPADTGKEKKNPAAVSSPGVQSMRYMHTRLTMQALEEASGGLPMVRLALSRLE